MRMRLIGLFVSSYGLWILTPCADWFVMALDMNLECMEELLTPFCSLEQNAWITYGKFGRRAGPGLWPEFPQNQREACLEPKGALPFLLPYLKLMSALCSMAY